MRQLRERKRQELRQQRRLLGALQLGKATETHQPSHESGPGPDVLHT